MNCTLIALCPADTVLQAPCWCHPHTEIGIGEQTPQWGTKVGERKCEGWGSWVIGGELGHQGGLAPQRAKHENIDYVNG